ncbi:hypothetical protein DFR31_2266 [Alkalispirillum mobile]|uniref:Nucleotidyltransferase substrate binding protein (TIGR01987 family) n=1 Tax=Alkalispirillum mobile TaxID=85925 RepID=A0A498C1M5_9GAMM|nr:hypothetical protein [Alkalispirillum mobile]RLK48386.1 hypothetical protein DFR31_2266 [Alkalispirillum mobile]
MTLDKDQKARLQFLARVVERESHHLQITDNRLFPRPFTVEDARTLGENIDLAERVEAFVSRFGRLQDTIGDKLLPAYLKAAGEAPGLAVDNLDQAERQGLIDSTEHWFALRKLRNQMVHEYIEDPKVLADALNSGHEAVPTLVTTGERLLRDIRLRGWV